MSDRLGDDTKRRFLGGLAFGVGAGVFGNWLWKERALIAPDPRPDDGFEVLAWQIRMRRRAADNIPDLGYGTCDCCKLPWYVVGGHTVIFETSESITSGCFPICEMCWKDLNTGDDRLPYYEAWIKRTYPNDNAGKLAMIRENILGPGACQCQTL